MGILFYQASPHWSGSSRAFAVAARGLAARTNDVTVVCRASSPASEGFTAEGLEVVPVHGGRTVAGDVWRLRAILKKRAVDVLFVHSEREQLVASTAARFSERAAVVRRIHAGGSALSGRNGRIAGKLAATQILYAMDSDRMRDGLANRALLAPLGVDVTRVDEVRAESRRMLGLDDATQLIACAIDAQAGSRVTTAMRTLALLADRHRDLRVAFVGRAADADDTRMHAAALGVTSLAHFLGERHDSPAVLAAADVGWVASEGDDGAFASLDFMAARVPIIAERSALISQYVPDGIAGVLLPTGDPADTASAVARFLSDAEKRTAMGNAGRTRARRDFGEEAMIDGFARAANVGGRVPEDAR